MRRWPIITPRWLYPGLKMKRWLLLMGASVILVFVGLTKLVSEQTRGIHITIIPEEILYGIRDYLIGLKFGDFVPIVLGIVGVVVAFKMIVRAVSTAFVPEHSEDAVDLTYKRLLLRRGPKIVAIGGGTGLPVTLSGLKEYTSNITAIVTMADDGGSSGRLRQTFRIPPPGDVRNCLVSLADASPLMHELFQYRFQDDPGLGGHSFGNLFLTAMSDLTGDFEKAIKESSRILAIRGVVVPVTLERVSLGAELLDKSMVDGESNISHSKSPIAKVFLKPEGAAATPEALQAIRQADVIVLGPGSLYTSILPNLLISRIADEIRHSKAMKLYICNIMTQPGETTGYSLSDHLSAIERHAGPGLFEYVVVNTEIIPPPVQPQQPPEARGDQRKHHPKSFATSTG